MNIERDLPHYLADIKEFGAKYCEKLARQACVLHVYEGNEGDISLETVERAAGICTWQLDENKRIFGMQPVVPRQNADAQLLLPKLIDLALKKGNPFRQNLALQNCPNSMRDHDRTVRVKAALEVLMMQDQIRVGKDEGGTGWINVNPALLQFQFGGQYLPLCY